MARTASKTKIKITKWLILGGTAALTAATIAMPFVYKKEASKSKDITIKYINSEGNQDKIVIDNNSKIDVFEDCKSVIEKTPKYKEEVSKSTQFLWDTAIFENGKEPVKKWSPVSKKNVIKVDTINTNNNYINIVISIPNIYGENIKQNLGSIENDLITNFSINSTLKDQNNEPPVYSVNLDENNNDKINIFIAGGTKKIRWSKNKEVIEGKIFDDFFKVGGENKISVPAELLSNFIGLNKEFTLIVKKVDSNDIMKSLSLNIEESNIIKKDNIITFNLSYDAVKIVDLYTTFGSKVIGSRLDTINKALPLENAFALNNFLKTYQPKTFAKDKIYIYKIGLNIDDAEDAIDITQTNFEKVKEIIKNNALINIYFDPNNYYHRKLTVIDEKNTILASKYVACESEIDFRVKDVITNLYKSIHNDFNNKDNKEFINGFYKYVNDDGEDLYFNLTPNDNYVSGSDWEKLLIELSRTKGELKLYKYEQKDIVSVYCGNTLQDRKKDITEIIKTNISKTTEEIKEALKSENIEVKELKIIKRTDYMYNNVYIVTVE